jgi:hypothetical protein
MLVPRWRLLGNHLFCAVKCRLPLRAGRHLCGGKRLARRQFATFIVGQASLSARARRQSRSRSPRAAAFRMRSASTAGLVLACSLVGTPAQARSSVVRNMAMVSRSNHMTVPNSQGSSRDHEYKRNERAPLPFGGALFFRVDHLNATVLAPERIRLVLELGLAIPHCHESRSGNLEMIDEVLLDRVGTLLG